MFNTVTKAIIFFSAIALNITCFFNGDMSIAAELISHKTNYPPTIDGKATDRAWQESSPLITKDIHADISIEVQSVHTTDTIFFLISFPDKDESRNHKSWQWNKNLQMYTVGKDREDVFVVKWNMENRKKDFKIYSDDSYKADIWYWKACRTDPAGFSDDKYHVLNTTKSLEATKLNSPSGKSRYLYRHEDNGEPAYATVLQVEYNGEKIPRYINQQATKSRADVKAKGHWQNGRWVIEFARALQTDHGDDVQFQTGGKYQFGVSRYEIAGRPRDNSLSQPLYGTGDINEIITLRFSK